MKRGMTRSPIIEAVSGWVFDRRMTGHAAVRRGPVLYETTCGRHYPGPITADTPSRICRECQDWLRVRAESPFRQGPAPSIETQGKLF
jgi:hypothetical protein